MQRLHPPLGRVGNERKRVSGEGGWNTDRASIHPPRRLVPRLRPSQREGEVHTCKYVWKGRRMRPINPPFDAHRTATSTRDSVQLIRVGHIDPVHNDTIDHRRWCHQDDGSAGTGRECIGFAILANVGLDHLCALARGKAHYIITPCTGYLGRQ